MSARLVLGALLACGLARASVAVTFDERVVAQRAIEQVYWKHRIWPKENPGSKPELSAVLSDAAINARVERYLRESVALERYWKRPITAQQLQAEIDRMTSRSRDPQMLRELFAALGNDPALVAETLARPSLADRLVRSWYEEGDRSPDKQPFDDGWDDASRGIEPVLDAPAGAYALASPAAVSCTEDTWHETFQGLEVRDNHTAVWTGTEMIVWGGSFSAGLSLNSGGRYNPATDTWLPTSRGPYCPSPRFGHTAVWTGTEMIVWGGQNTSSGDPASYTNTGGRYDPTTDTWTPTASTTADARRSHTAVWTGTKMVSGAASASPSSARGACTTPLPAIGSRPTPDLPRATSTARSGREAG